MCHGVPLASVYKGGRGGGAAGPMGAPGGVLLQPGVGLPPLALLEKEGGREKEERGAPPPFLVLFGLKGRGRATCPSRPLSFSNRAHQGPLLPGGVPVTLRYSSFLRKLPKPFRCPNIVVQYINLYVSTIPRLLVMSVITSGTPNNLRYIKTQKP